MTNTGSGRTVPPTSGAWLTYFTAPVEPASDGRTRAAVRTRTSRCRRRHGERGVGRSRGDREPPRRV
ncbi:hypothetical protein BRC78_05480, partial [Halobacteriales archaeon QH_8_68_33]